MRLVFDEQLNLLNREMITTGALCEDAIKAAIRILNGGVSERESKDIAEIVDTINHKEREIEDMCLKLMMKQQPVATDLRVISASLKMVSDLERIGDNADDIAEILSQGNIKPEDEKDDLLDMGQAASKMVTDAIDAFVNRDAETAAAVVKADDEVDDYFNQIKSRLAGDFGDESKDIEMLLDYLMVAKYFERIGDHAVNIARWVNFAVTGVLEGNTP